MFAVMCELPEPLTEQASIVGWRQRVGCELAETFIHAPLATATNHVHFRDSVDERIANVHT